jgi:hypothetical protein
MILTMKTIVFRGEKNNTLTLSVIFHSGNTNFPNVFNGKKCKTRTVPPSEKGILRGKKKRFFIE